MTQHLLDASATSDHRKAASHRTSAPWLIGAFLSIGVALFSYRYLPKLVFGAPLILGNALSRPWLYLHIAGAATALLILPLQLLPAFRQRGSPWHRRLGRVYVVACLTGGVGGFVSAFGSTAGPIATAGFATLAVVWILANAMGWICALQGRFAEHRRWMLYSFAMTFAAVTLRLYLPIFPLLHLPFIDGYRTASWVSWIGNLLIVEVYLRRPSRSWIGRGPCAMRDGVCVEPSTKREKDVDPSSWSPKVRKHSS